MELVRDNRYQRIKLETVTLPLMDLRQISVCVPAIDRQGCEP